MKIQDDIRCFILDVDDEVEADVCVNNGVDGDCCSEFGKISIRLCRSLIGQNFYVYKLIPPPKFQRNSPPPVAYCVDPEPGSCPPNYKRDRNNTCTSESSIADTLKNIYDSLLSLRKPHRCLF